MDCRVGERPGSPAVGKCSRRGGGRVNKYRSTVRDAAPKVNAGPHTVRRPPPRARGQTSNVGEAQNSKVLAERRTPAMSVEL